MRGLIIKDFLMLKQQVRVLLTIMAIWVVISVIGKNPSTMTFVIFFSAIMLPISGLSYDEYSKWNEVVFTMPIKPKDVIKSKYIVGIGFIVIAVLVSSIISIIMGSGMLAKLNLLFIPAGIIFLSIMFPLLFKFGTEKSRLISMSVMMLPTIIFMIVAQMGYLDHLNIKMLMKWLPYSFLVVSIFCLAISYKVSLNIFEKKEY